jgi:hypothetical protein
MHKGNVFESQKGIKDANLQVQRPDVQVTVSGYFYAVGFGHGADLGQHRVGKDRRCSCSLGAGCPAVMVVVDYLNEGGVRAPDPPPGFFPVAPAICPVAAPKHFTSRT